MKKHVISCRPNGIVEAVQNDELPLHEIGKSKMTRASDVTWSDGLQMWVASIRPPFIKDEHAKEWRESTQEQREGRMPLWKFAHKSRAKAIEWELVYLNNR